MNTGSTAATAGAAGAAAAGAAIANAIKASGVLIRVEPEDFSQILTRNTEGLVVYATGGIFTKNHQYLTSYKGLSFFTKAAQPLSLPGKCEVILAKNIWIPG
jgi:hypothetical protein